MEASQLRVSGSRTAFLPPALRVQWDFDFGSKVL